LDQTLCCVLINADGGIIANALKRFFHSEVEKTGVPNGKRRGHSNLTTPPISNGPDWITVQFKSRTGREGRPKLSNNLKKN